MKQSFTVAAGLLAAASLGLKAQAPAPAPAARHADRRGRAGETAHPRRSGAPWSPGRWMDSWCGVAEHTTAQHAARDADVRHMTGK